MSPNWPEANQLAISKRGLKVALHSFGSLWVYVIAKSWQEKGCSSQAETWQVKNILMKDFDWHIKFDVFVASMATWMIEYNL